MWGSSSSSRASRRPRRDPANRVLGRRDRTIWQSNCTLSAAGTVCSRVRLVVEEDAAAAVAMARVAAAAAAVAVAKAKGLAAVAVCWVQWEAALVVAGVPAVRTTAVPGSQSVP